MSKDTINNIMMTSGLANGLGTVYYSFVYSFLGGFFWGEGGGFRLFILVILQFSLTTSV